MRLGLTLLALAYTAGLIAYFAALGLGAGQDGWLGVVRELTLYVFLPAPALLLAAVLLRGRAALLLMLLPIGLFAWFYGPQFVPRARAEGAGPKFRALTFNAGGNEVGGRPEPLIRLLRTEQPDLVALQEIPRSTLDVLAATLSDDYPYQVGTPDTATLSHFPVLAANDVLLDASGYLSEQLELDVEGQIVTVTNVHVKRPTAGLSLRRILSWARTYDAGWRDAQMEAIAARVRSVTGPQLLMGDFNQTPWSTSYSLIATQLHDSFREVGWGFGNTFPNQLTGLGAGLALPLLRIDYVFHSGELIAQDAHTGPDAGSHHLPVVVDLALREP
ncbi:MAG TPA: endonuclease/exonuclease/phosphatase family protein [Chloroflexota bacterium]|nr:endonuclease/exonuclease/phosphatase family protein [Chloroflexota bacterium]